MLDDIMQDVILSSPIILQGKMTEKKLYPFQEEGVQNNLRILSGYRAAYCGDEPGLGKTVQSMATVKELGAKRVVVFCPSPIKHVWENHFREWLNKEAAIVTTAKDIEHAFYSDVIVMSYRMMLNDRVAKLIGERKKEDLVILDEAHKIKNPYATTARKLVTIPLRNTNNSLFLSGTPLKRCTSDLYVPMRYALGGDVPYLDDYDNFCRQYAERKYNGFEYYYTGGKNLKELKQLLRSTFFYRRKKFDVAKQLPDKTYTKVPIKLAPSRVKDSVESEFETKKAQKEFAAYYRSTEKDDSMQLHRRKLGLLKARASMPFILEMYEAAAPLVIFAYHNDVAEYLLDRLTKNRIDRISYVSGRVQSKYISIEEARFQNGETDIFLGTLKRVGEGLTLTRSSNVICVEQDVCPSTMEQAVDRCHRLTQTNAVNAYYCVSRDPIDLHIVNTLMTKHEMIKQVID